MSPNLQGDDIWREGVRNGPDVFAQGVIFGARASPGAPGALLPGPAALRREEQRRGAQQQRHCPEAQSPAAGAHPASSEQEITTGG